MPDRRETFSYPITSGSHGDTSETLLFANFGFISSMPDWLCPAFFAVPRRGQRLANGRHGQPLSGHKIVDVI